MIKVKKIFLVIWPLLVALLLFFSMFAIPTTFMLEQSLKETIISIMFSLFGFSITSLTIIAGFMKDSLKVLNAIKKGYIYTVVFLIAFMMVDCVISLVATFLNWPSFIYVSICASGIFVIGYFIYVVLTIVVYLVRTSKTHNL